ncbi:hypothetical protein E4K67_11170 [Desulfosporosinus fructosivorans]|uniref:Uncharacterized protein n=1 Tax=Desulfosporosinus fructosivorans TaxID=2018669 RepID=A0A4Z0R7U7_9FIRM|nr:hypothetical protein [Desulfosporosinus fructosivorans]TGE38485.1 hypothetical protein E4K67_11170 [Desulfosporosinus fructosivorans]
MNLEQAVTIAPYMQDFYDEDVTVVISSLQSVIVVINYKNQNLIVSQDEPTNEKTITSQCLKERKRVVMRVPLEKSQFGISYIAIANPLWNNGKLEGAMTVVISGKRYDALKLHDSIEGARAGDKRWGLEVVADEFGKLYESEKNSDLVVSDDVIEVNVSELFN